MMQNGNFGQRNIAINKTDQLCYDDNAVFTRILRGQPNILQTASKSSVKKSSSRVRKFFDKITKSKRNVVTEDVNDIEFICVQTTEKSVENSLSLVKPKEAKQIVHKGRECKQEQPFDIPDVSTLDHYTVREDIMEEVRKGRYIIDIAPSDLVDFGGQRSYDMTHQLFVQHQGSFIIMFNGRYGLHEPLNEYPQGDVTSKCRYYV
ncbi:unnamed protein product [Mytilus coruscus]|uniref:Uncharacterized protein n=1 Tax=Mytilus coruscus TaxID=42192 RepID=A0A6J8CR42_MYTCO|nr:unnamed protein product [Mytilus coruscus]